MTAPTAAANAKAIEAARKTASEEIRNLARALGVPLSALKDPSKVNQGCKKKK